MKKLPIVFLVLASALSPAAAQDVDIQLAVVTQSMNETVLENLAVPEEDIETILELQEDFRLLKESTAIELNVIKAQIAQQLYYADAGFRDAEKLLERASELRLEQEKAQVRTYLAIRERLGQENWDRLMQQIRVQVRRRQQQEQATGNQGETAESQGQSRSGAPSGQSGAANR